MAASARPRHAHSLLVPSSQPPPSHSRLPLTAASLSLQVQLTDFENAAFTVFVVLVSRVILYFNLNFYMPISCVDCNMRRAAERDAVTQGKFCFRQSPISGASSGAEHKRPPPLPLAPPPTCPPPRAGSHARRPPSSPTKREARDRTARGCVIRRQPLTSAAGAALGGPGRGGARRCVELLRQHGRRGGPSHL